MNRLFVLALIALLQLRQLPCDCQAAGLLAICHQDCTAHLRHDSTADTHGCEQEDDHFQTDHGRSDLICPEQGHADDACESEQSGSSNEPLTFSDEHSHPRPVCEHLRAAQSYDRPRCSTSEPTLPLVLSQFDCTTRQPLIGVLLRTADPAPPRPIPISARLAALSSWLI